MISWQKNDDFLNKTQAELVKNFTKSGVYFVSRVRGYLNTSQPYNRSASGKYYGLAPSAPGNFPHKLSGQLQRSITWTLDKKKMVLTVGSNLAGYPSILQLGSRFMKPRPWLTLAFDREKDKIGKIIVGK